MCSCRTAGHGAVREKGGKRHHAVQCHHNLEEWLTVHLDGPGLRSNPKDAVIPHDRDPLNLTKPEPSRR
jgi:hypothetical protein